MINKVTIKYLYKHTHRPKNGFSEGMLKQVAECCWKCFKIVFEDGYMTVGAFDADNPFRSIRLSCIKGFRIVDNEVAVVMDQSILFFNNATGAVKINFRCHEEHWWHRLLAWLRPCQCRQRRACVQ